MSEFGAEGAEWLRGDGGAADVVISSRVRLARNLAGFQFARRCSREIRSRIVEVAQRHLLESDLAPRMLWVDLAGLPEVERSLLVERHLISKHLAKADGPRAVAISAPDERLSIMVNEEDHLRLQMLRSGLSVQEAYASLDVIDDKIESRVDYAYSPRFGYLTACPTNVGTGIRVSVMLHLPGLKLSGEMDKVHRAAKAMSLAVRGFYGEGSEAVGDFFQVSNQTTLGKSESELITTFEQRIIPKFVEYERMARRTLIEKRRVFVEDQVFRALGTLRHARLLKADEVLQLLSFVRFGIVMGLIDDLPVRRVNELTLSTQPAHLQRLVGRSLDQAERRVERANRVRVALAEGMNGEG